MLSSLVSCLGFERTLHLDKKVEQVHTHRGSTKGACEDVEGDGASHQLVH